MVAVVGCAEVRSSFELVSDIVVSGSVLKTTGVLGGEEGAASK